MMNHVDHCIEQTEAVVRSIRPLLAGREPEVQSAALADLLSMWLVSFPNVMRAELLENHIELVRRLIPATERELFGERGHPHNSEGN